MKISKGGGNQHHEFWTKLKNLCAAMLRKYVPPKSTIANFDYPIPSNRPLKKSQNSARST